jgi:hypothetical protein
MQHYLSPILEARSGQRNDLIDLTDPVVCESSDSSK